MPSLSRARKLAILLPAVMFTLLLAGCGGSSKTAANPTSTAAPTNPSTTVAGGANRSAYRQCLTAHGIPANALGGFGRGGGGTGATPGTGGSADTSSPASSAPPRTLPPGVTQAQLQAAVAACRSLAPQGNLANSPQAAAYRNCLTVNGVTLTNGGLGTLNRSDPKVAAALTACANLRPARTGGSTTTTPTTAAS